MPVAPLVLAECSACGLVQLEGTVERSLLFNEKYPYRSGTNNTVREHLKGIAEQARHMASTQSGIVVDIGSNDGTLLRMFPRDWGRWGFDPSFPYSGGYHFNLLQETFPPRQDNFKADVIISAAMFYDVESPQDFVYAIARALAPDGIWINEFNYLPSMLENHAYDMIGHEHLCYYRLSDLTTLCAVASLEVVHAETNVMNGGSLRVVVKHKGVDRPDGTVVDLQRKEDNSYAIAGLGWWVDECRRRLQALSAYLELLREQGNSIWIRGASTRGLTILALLESHFPLRGAADRNPDKWGCYIPGTTIQIHSEEEGRAKADVFLVLPYSYLDEIRERDRATDFSKRGGRYLVPVPEVRLL